jgi:hypothetical protein
MIMAKYNTVMLRKTDNFSTSLSDQESLCRRRYNIVYLSIGLLFGVLNCVLSIGRIVREY